MRALITNDDGVRSVGIRALTRVAVEAGLDVTVAAPHEERSGSSAALSALNKDGRLILERMRFDDIGDLPVYAVHASPALITFTATRGAFGDPPDIVLSGINHGPNTGQAVLHSGTVGAALTAAAQGVPSLAVSLAAARPTQFESAAIVAREALDWFLEHRTSPYVLNVNVPDVPPDQLRGIRIAGLAPFGAVQANIGERGSGYISMTFREIDDDPAPGTDVAVLREGFASATALKAPVVYDEVDISSLSSSYTSAPTATAPTTTA
ncbi:MAG TPA: 5'/3'-nucleotidase SurE [Jatrophihabitantaceae bacterium]|nr:5'/3'-nucleotidase SurE [Jatrophihabitantaceae bacterium]